MSTSPEATAEILALGRELLSELKGLRADYARHTAGATQRAPSGAQPAGAGGGAVFGNYGRSKGQAVAGATEGDLEYYAAGCRRTLGDLSKARWHDKELVLLAAIEAELLRQRGGSGHSAPPSDPGGFDYVPPVDDSEMPF